MGGSSQANTDWQRRMDRADDDARTAELRDCVAAFLALCLADLGQEREGLRLLLAALTERLPKYRRSLAAYTAELPG